MDKFIIGINGSFHDASVCVLKVGMTEPFLMLSEDRQSGIPHHFGFPFESMKIAIKEIGDNEIISVGYSRNKNHFKYPPAGYFSDILGNDDVDKIEKYIEKSIVNCLDNLNDVESVNDFIESLTSCRDKLSLKKRICYLLFKFSNENITEKNIRLFLPDVKIHGFNHHDTHAATFYSSLYEEATIITWDGRGEFDSTVLSLGKDNGIKRIKEIQYPFSLGNFYEVFSEYIGLGRIEGPGKLMGLAAYGDDRFVGLFNELIIVDDYDFSFKFNKKYLSYSQNERLSFSNELKEIIGKDRKREEQITEIHKAIAYAVQNTIEKVCIKLVDNAINITGVNSLVLSGGLSLNCVMNEKIREKLGVDPFLIPPCGDDGTAFGSALLLLNDYTEKNNKSERSRVEFNNTYGTDNNSKLVKEYLEKNNVIFKEYKPKDIADLLSNGKFIGYMQGRYEVGPRALGFRSILADPRKLDNWTFINSNIKFREDFRPFAPVMLYEDAQLFWGNQSDATDSPYMLLAPRMSQHAKEKLPAVTHCDLSARVQTLSKKFNEDLYNILYEFKKNTGVGVLLNTSLNMSGESIIVNYIDLVRFMCFSDLDAIVINEYLIEKKDNERGLVNCIAHISSREEYLSNRKNEYKSKWNDYILKGEYMNYDDYFNYLFK
jgi:carbamoyltransferase